MNGVFSKNVFNLSDADIKMISGGQDAKEMNLFHAEPSSSFYLKLPGCGCTTQPVVVHPDWLGIAP